VLDTSVCVCVCVCVFVCVCVHVCVCAYALSRVELQHNATHCNTLQHTIIHRHTLCVCLCVRVYVLHLHIHICVVLCLFPLGFFIVFFALPFTCDVTYSYVCVT